MTPHDELYFVRLPLLEGLRVLAETRLAYRLFFWLVGRVTREYRTPWGIRCGGVLGLAPQKDYEVAADIVRCSQAPCTAWTVRSWRRALARLGLIACHQTPIGLQIFVINSNKMPEDKLVELPDWALPVLAGPMETYLARHGERGQECTSDRPVYAGQSG